MITSVEDSYELGSEGQHTVTDLDRYVRKLTSLRRDKSRMWPQSSLGRSPYKPLLLLSVLDQLEQVQTTSNLIPLSPELSNLFDLYCSVVMPSGMTCNIAMPFYHLQGEGFWHLVPLSGRESFVTEHQMTSASQLVRNVEGARLDDDLFVLVALKQSRDVLRAALISACFDQETQPRLWLRSSLNQEAYTYSNALLQQALGHLKDAPILGGGAVYSREARDQGFRHAVVITYHHRCASCGLRIVTAGGRTAVEAAHIVPWAETRNDHPTNGLALCRLCHWSFDEGLMSVAEDYRVVLSPQLDTRGNMPGFLSMLADRPIFLPNEAALYPDRWSLHWRNEHVFRKV